MKICILSHDRNVVILKRSVTNANMSKLKLVFAKTLNKNGKLKAQENLIETVSEKKFHFYFLFFPFS